MTEANPGKFGADLETLKEVDPAAAERIEQHFGGDAQRYTLGQLGHLDVSYGQADPRSEAGNDAIGDSTARGGSGPNKE